MLDATGQGVNELLAPFAGPRQGETQVRERLREAQVFGSCLAAEGNAD